MVQIGEQYFYFLLPLSSTNGVVDLRMTDEQQHLQQMLMQHHGATSRGMPTTPKRSSLSQPTSPLATLPNTPVTSRPASPTFDSTPLTFVSLLAC